MQTIKVIGHTPPDTDSTCSPIVYAWFLREIKKMPAQAYIGAELNKETEYILNRFGIETPEMIESLNADDEVVLIDTNNAAEILPGLDEARVIEIIDHHKLTEITTSEPITITIRPVACVATILWELLPNDLPEDIAGLMLAAIVSDTLNFTSPTTTDLDRKAAGALAGMTGIDINQLAAEMFAAKSDLSGMDPLEIVMSDYKNYDFNGGTYFVGVLETTDPVQALNMKTELLAAMNSHKQTEGLTGIFFFVVDIVNTNSTLLIAGEEEQGIAEKAFGVEIKDSEAFLPGVVSRKKQMLPEIEAAVS